MEFQLREALMTEVEWMMEEKEEGLCAGRDGRRVAGAVLVAMDPILMFKRDSNPTRISGGGGEKWRSKVGDGPCIYLG